MRLLVIASAIAVLALGGLTACGPKVPALDPEAAKRWASEEDPRYVPGDRLAAEHRLTDIVPLKEPVWPQPGPFGFGRGVYVAIEVDEQGRVSDARLTESYSDDEFGFAAERLRRNAVEQAKGLRFKPFLRNGKPVKAALKIVIPILDERAPVRDTPFPEGDLGSAVVELSRTGCFGTCPSYTVTLRGDGEMIWRGKGYVLVADEVREKIDPVVVQQLLDRARSLKFYGLQDSYRAEVTDQPSYRVTIVYGGGRKTVVDYAGEAAGMPYEVTMLEEAIDRAARTARWIEPGPDTVPSLRAAGWDLTSPKAGELVARLLAPMHGRAGRDAAVELIAVGAPVNVEPPRKLGEFNALPIVWAVQKGDLELYRLLVAGGALRRAGRDLLGKVLIAAAHSQDPAMIEEILKLDPPIDARDEWNFRDAPLSIAASGVPEKPAAQRRAVALLLARGADVKFADEAGRTALHGAGDPEVARMLIAAGAPIGATNDWNETPLLSTESEDVALVLLAAGADTSLMSKMDETIEIKARKAGWKRVLAVLAKRRK